jgi:hypothetical protein
MATRKMPKRQTMIYKAIHRKLNISSHELGKGPNFDYEKQSISMVMCDIDVP